ncbi:MAG: hypothetical protein V2B19_20885 [Pseudomonadota bacterium]
MKISRVTIITLGVADLGKATEFYKTVLGTPPNTSSDAITFIQLPGTWIALYPFEKLAVIMKKLIILATVTFAIFGLHTTHAKGGEIIKVNNALFPNGKVKNEVSFSSNKGRIEEGIYEGVKYRIFYSDGSGSVQGLPMNTLDYVRDKYGTNWSIQCKLDDMDDTHWCSLDREDMRVGIWKDGTPFVSIGSSHYPNSKIAVRVDKNKPISTSEKSGFTNAQSAEIIRQLKKGSTVLTRFQEWPYQIDKDKSIDLYGFPQAWVILQKIHNSVKVQ